MANGLSGMSGLAQKSISQTAHLIQTKQISPVEIVESVISNVEALDADLRAYVSVHPENALIQARQAEAEMSAGHYRGPMHGIPICIKDNIAVAGWPTTNGSVLMAKNVTDYDARVVTRLKGAGAIILGKNNMHEWAMGGTCSGMYYGTVRNPWDTSRIPGGSSGGSAAAVSACLALASIGTDGMGSIRAPAAFCGVVGMKPTYGLISRFGELPATSSWIDHLGPIAKTVADVGTILSVLEGFDPADPTSRTRPSDLDSREFKGLRGLRVGIVSNYFADDLVPEMASAFARAISSLEAAGANVSVVSAPSLGHLPLTLLGIHGERESFLRDFAVKGEGFASEEIRMRILAAQLVPGADVRRAHQVRAMVRRELLTLLEGLDVIATPTTATTAFEIDAASVALGSKGERVDIASPGVANRITVRLTYPFNVAGCPAISVPGGFLDDGLPWGMHFAASPWQDHFLLRVAAAFEEQIGPGYKVPPVLAKSLQHVSV